MHVIANPATKFAENGRDFRPKIAKQKKNQLKCQLASFEALLSLDQTIDDPTPSWTAVACCVLSYQNDIRQQLVISMFSRITSDKHVQLKNVRGHGSGFAFFGSLNKKAATHVPVGRAHDDGRSLDTDKSYLLARSCGESHDRACCDQVFVPYSVLCTWARAPSFLTTFVYACLLSHQDRQFGWVFVAVQETQTVAVVCCTAAHLIPTHTHTNLWSLLTNTSVRDKLHPLDGAKKFV